MINNSESEDLVIVLTTEQDLKSAHNLLNELLIRKHASCVSLKQIESHYWWNGNIDSTSEVELSIKTTLNKLNDLKKTINEIHTYKVPQLLLWRVDTTSSYYEWNEDSLTEMSN